MRFEGKGSLWYALTLVELKHLLGCYRFTSLKVDNFSVPDYMQDGFLIPRFSKGGSKVLFTCPHKRWVPFEKLCFTQDLWMEMADRNGIQPLRCLWCFRIRVCGQTGYPQMPFDIFAWANELSYLADLKTPTS